MKRRDETPFLWHGLVAMTRATATLRSDLATRCAAAFRGAGPADAPRTFVVGHRDVIPRALLARIASSLGSVVVVLEASSSRVVGWIEIDERRAAEDACRIGRAISAELAPGLVVGWEPAIESEQPEGAELAFVEGTYEGVAIRAYLAAESFCDATLSRSGETTVVLSIVAGRSTLDVDSLRSLDSGDVVTLDVAYRDTFPAWANSVPTDLWLEDSRGDVRRALPSRIPHSPSAEAMNESIDEPSSASDDDSLVAVDRLRVDLVVELARVATTVGELERLAPGSVLVAGRPLGRHVVLRNHGQAVARGELVDVDGELGVRITSVASR